MKYLRKFNEEVGSDKYGKAQLSFEKYDVIFFENASSNFNIGGHSVIFVDKKEVKNFVFVVHLFSQSTQQFYPSIYSFPTIELCKKMIEARVNSYKTKDEAVQKSFENDYFIIQKVGVDEQSYIDDYIKTIVSVENGQVGSVPGATQSSETTSVENPATTKKTYPEGQVIGSMFSKNLRK